MFLQRDIALAIVGMIGISITLFILAIVLGRKWPLVAMLAGIFATASLIVHALWLNDNLILTRLLPISNLMIWSNIAAPAAALLAGIAWVRMASPRWQKVLCVGVLLSIGAWRLIQPVRGSTPTIGPDRWTRGICRQSSASSCSAAAVATLLAAHGISSSEAEMISLCLTHEDGTTNLGLYRGLRIKTADRGLRIRAGHPSVQEIREWPLPAIVNVGSRNSGGWLGIGDSHSVVIFAIRSDDTVVVGDPFAGRQIWRVSELERRYGGQAICLIPSAQ